MSEFIFPLWTKKSAIGLLVQKHSKLKKKQWKKKSFVCSSIAKNGIRIFGGTLNVFKGSYIHTNSSFSGKKSKLKIIDANYFLFIQLEKLSQP